MAVYYKFKSARDYDSISMDGPFISVGTLKEKIFESKHLGRGTDFDLLVTNAQTNEEYLDEEMLIPKNTSVLIRRVPGRPRLPIVTEQEQKAENKVVETEPANSSLPADDMSAMKYVEDSDWDEFGNDLYSIPDQLPVQSINMIQEAPPTSTADEESKIKALIDTPALDWQHQGSDFGPGRGFGRGMGGRMGGGRGFGMERKTPPQGYVCHRCKVPGHFIQHCPTNGDPNYDVKRVKQPTGIPRSMLMVNPQGSYALPNGSVAVLKPNEAAFEKEMEGMPSTTRSVGDLPPELHCPLCSNVMKDAVLTSKCCFKSFCDKCIRDYIISKSTCVCGATNVLADDLLPNKTLRDTINRILETGNSSTENAGSTYQVQDMESARCPQPKIPSPTSSAASKGGIKISPVNDGTTNIKDTADETKVVSAPPQASEHVKIPRVGDVSEATHESKSVKEPVSQGSAQVVEEEVQQKLVPTEAGKKKKKKKVRMPTNDFQWKPPHDLGAENYMMQMGPPPGYNPYWNGMQPCMDGFMAPYAGPMHMMGYGHGPYDMPFANGMPHDPFANGMPHDPFGMQGYMMPPIPPPPHRDLSEFSMGMNAPPPAMSREEFEARKADVRRKRENERRVERDFSKDREFGREVSSVGDVSSIKPKTKPIPPSSGSDYHQLRHRSERPSPDSTHREVDPPRAAKRKSEHHSERERERERDDRDRDYDHHDRHQDRDYELDRHQHRRHHHRTESSSKKSTDPVTKSTSRKSSEPEIKSKSRKSSEPVTKSLSKTAQVTAAEAAAAAAADRKQKASVFSRISFPSEEEAAAKKRKLSAASTTEASAATTASVSAKAPSTTHLSNGGRKSKAVMDDYESSDDDDEDDERHFKRRPSRYEPSPPPPVDDWAEEGRHSRGTRDRKHR